MKLTKKAQRQFLEIVRNKKIYPVYQPIVSLKDGSVYGYEALSRTDLENCVFNTEEMFHIAEKIHRLWKLESICRRLAIKNAKDKPENTKLFINVDPKIIRDNKFRSGVTAGYLKKYGLNPEDIVLEITERNSIEDPVTFKKSIEHYTNQNYKIAIDDFGSDYAGPNRLCLLRPDIIKIDMNIVRNIDNDSFRHYFVKSLSFFGKSTGTKIIAEGIETRSELEHLINLGIDYGQGFYLAKPEKKFCGIPKEIAKEILLFNENRQEISGSKVFEFMQSNKEDEMLYIYDKNKNLIEKIPCCEVKNIFFF